MSDACVSCREYADLQINNLRREISLLEKARDTAINLARAEMETRIAGGKWSVGIVATLVPTLVAILLFVAGRH